MVIGEVRATKSIKVKKNPYYGSFEIVDTFTHRIVNEQYIGLVSPENGIHITFKNSSDNDKLDIIVTKYAFTGELEKYVDDDTEFSTSFSFGGRIYEVCVDKRGQLVSVDEWYGYCDFEDGNEPVGHYTKKSKGLKWELIDM